MTDATHPGRGRVLVVDDEPEIRETIVDVLGDEGYEVHGAANGREALTHLQAAAALPDVILLDLLMPVLDGEQFRSAQLQDPRLAAIPTVVLSANARVRETAARMGVAGWLCKPLELDGLLAAVERHLARHS